MSLSVFDSSLYYAYDFLTILKSALNRGCNVVLALRCVSFFFCQKNRLHISISSIKIASFLLVL